MRASLTSTINRNVLRSGRAFTLAEALIASVVLSLAVSGIATALVASTQATRSTRELSTGVNAARSLMETIAARPIDVAEARVSGGTAASETVATTYANFSDTLTLTSDEGGRATPYRRAARVVTFSRSIASVLVASGEPNIVPTLTITPPADLAVVTVTITMPDGSKASVARLATRVQKE